MLNPAKSCCDREFLYLQPDTKYPGDTLIRDMVPELLLLITKELSLEKASGTDFYHCLVELLINGFRGSL